MSRDSYLLAIESSTSLASVALARGGEPIARSEGLPSGDHASSLIPAVAELLDREGIRGDEITGLVVGEGPGSFTGVRIAVATARGLAHGWKIPLWPRSSLAAGACSPTTEASDDEEVRYVLFDARGDRIYGGCYRLGRGALDLLVAPHAGTLADLLASEIPEGAVFRGEGAVIHSERLRGAGHRVTPLPAGVPTAEGLLRVHALAGGDLAPPPEGRWEPAYLRPSSATPGRRTGATIGAG